MTGYTVHTGSTEKFSAGWDVIFKQGKRGPSGTKPKKRPAVKKARSQGSKPKKRTKGRK